MQRRNFLILGSIFGLSPYVKAEEHTELSREFEKVKSLIAAVQEHMFPAGNKIPSAKDMDANRFLFEAISHNCYDKDIRAFVIEGAKEFKNSTKGDFLTMNKKDKEKALREYEQSSYGQSWLSRIMVITLEGIFSDPIYGSNKKEAGWKALNSYGGFPRAKSRYIQL
ncbi:Tat (twin-arginine translocation) pathway signal sequence domain protein [hydrothermal vent metagenome]|uniref:Tat (Twin-arginine translocation) pathway signal sequence domain protein n=1 Tax=hydrothermal vent metagenome TaxID=652676 RepID=A0A1W1EFL8_9ZZZZ